MGERTIKIAYALTICLGAFLMFLIQPLIGKIIIPQYGGVSQVWCLCLLFFQMTLLGGYGLNFLLSKLPVKKQGIIYIALMLISLVLVHIPYDESWAPFTPNAPIISLLTKLTMYLAAPAILLSTVSMVMQNWYRILTQKDPYHFYSISNIGSMSALISYPILIEPNLTIINSLVFWTFGYWTLVTLTCIVSFMLLKAKIVGENEKNNNESSKIPTAKDYLYWCFLSAAGTIILTSFTNYIVHDLATIPLLYIIPLILYLLSFIITFSGDRAYNSKLYTYLTIFSVLIMFFVQPGLQIFVNPGYLIIMLLLSVLIMFLLCMLCNGELFKSRPEPKHLSVYYLIIAAGGALGGIFVNIIAPLIFHDYYEFSLILFILASLALYIIYKNDIMQKQNQLSNKIALVLIAGIVILGLCKNIFDKNPNTYLTQRNFYGVVKLIYMPKDKKIELCNGLVRHGGQLVDITTNIKSDEPVDYFGKQSGIGIFSKLIRKYNNNKQIKMGVIGLGAGSIASYGNEGDIINFYEIDPKVSTIAQKFFTFLPHSKAKVKTILGDGRLSLKRTTPQNYDILVIDAFTGDSIPIHLLTKEALNLYLSNIKKDGIILIHISNKYLDLNKVISNIADDLGLYKVTMTNYTEAPCYKSTYCVLSRDKWFLNSLTHIDQETANSFQFTQNSYVNVDMSRKFYKKVGIWTDNYSNLLSVFAK